MLGTSIAWSRSAEWRAKSLEILTPSVWMDWKFDNINNEQYLPVVYDIKETKGSSSARRAAVDCQKVWLLGNEPELAATFIAPDIAAKFTANWNSTSWGAPGVILSDNGFLWLDEYRRIGGRFGTHMHVHIYEVNTPEDWAAKWWRLREWMERNNLVRPVIVSETCGWDASVDQRSIMDRIVAIQQLDKLLQYVIWYSDADYWESWMWANLRNEDGTLTLLGEHFVKIQQPRFSQFLTMVGNG